MRAIWSGAISFGLIYIPVKIYDGTRSHRIDFDLLRKSDRCRIRYARVCRETGEEVPNDEIVKGYQYRKGDYVIISSEDFKRASVHKSQTIDLVSFVNAEEVDQKYLEKPYFLEPVKEAAKAYALLREALRKSGKAGIGRYVMRTREHMALIKAEENAIVLNQMRFADELRSSQELAIPQPGTSDINERELEMAIKLIDQLTGKWNPQQYKDTYYEDLRKIIQEKIEGKVPGAPVEPQPIPVGVTDLFSRLSKSLEMAQHRKEAA
ncbi:MAG TPA: Ku protein [Chitinispirillaceae bacterium]|nr:Ku protein [Chitinispirillaceae bacterium]